MIALQPITPAIVQVYKAVRLRALLDTPLAFGSTHAGEVLLSDDDWQTRATRMNGEMAIGYLAMDGSDACGLAACFLDQNDPGKAHLVSMWVAASHRRRGVGGQLITAAVDWARSRSVTTLVLMVTSNNHVATRFYERLGFTKTGRIEDYPNNSALVEYEMSRSIEPRRR